MSERRNRRRLKKVEEPDNSGRWLITYSDLITLLLVFFIVMFSMSTIENQRFNALISSLKNSFQGDSILQSMGYVATDKNQASPTIPNIKKTNQLTADQKKKDVRQLDALYVRLNKYIKANRLSPQVSLVATQRGVQLTFREKILFDLGSAQLKPHATPLLEKIGGILKEVPNEISVEGHTDNTPYRNSHSAIHSNWELSGVHAQNVMLFLIKKDHLAPNRFHFIGYGEYQPIVKNDTPAHKAINRRVNIVVLRAGNQAD
ncbi:flagellar motor protein MotB [Sporolactobacillus vineae]|uniref:flagellar motor protein MotB n=1 Tax=Sporolactobacillus vineae TaxID=444463 RepID=UPI00028A0EE2|nr:flagellar motor protein MotB [Sporolactobacillus vineae]